MSDLDVYLNGVEDELSDGSEARPEPVGFRMRVVLIDPPVKLDRDAEQKRRLPDALREAAKKANFGLEELAFEGRFEADNGKRVKLTCADGCTPDDWDEVTFKRVAKFLEKMFPSVDPPVPYLGSFAVGLEKWCDAVTDDTQDLVRRLVIREDLEAQKKSPVAFIREEGLRVAVEGALGELPVLGPSSEDAADELWARVHRAAPWLADATAECWRAMKGELRAGHPPWFPPILLVGDPGVGKTSLGRAVARELGSPLVELDAGSGNAAFSVAGTERGWGTSGPGRPVEEILRSKIANPVIILNEVDRIGVARGTSGIRTSMSDALLPLLDRSSALRWTCPALRIPFDMSRVLWLLTANSLDGVDEALLSRVRVFRVPRPSADHVRAIVLNRLGDLDPDLAEQAGEMIAHAWSRRSLTLRQVDAMCERVRRAATGPMLH